MARCEVCHHHCEGKEGSFGLCRARKVENGVFSCANYGALTSIALDPIEKKPLNLFHPGSCILSVGSFGCNLRCPFCQNHEISYGFGKEYGKDRIRYIGPGELAELAEAYRSRGNIGVAFTYNEPLVGWEYVVDAAREVKNRGMSTVLVSNGCVTPEVAEKVIPWIDAMNIDLKGFTDRYYHDTLQGDRQMVMDFIEKAAKTVHMEVTTLVVPGYNDTGEEMDRISNWVAGLNGGSGAETIALHISRYFPRFHMTDVPATDVGLIFELVETARKNLRYVFAGNV